MLKLDFLVTFRHISMKMSRFVPISKRNQMIFCSENDFFPLSAFQGYDRFALQNFTRGLIIQNVIK